MSFRVLPLPDRVAQLVRETGLAPGYGHPVHAQVADAEGYGPCRQCLRRTRAGERRLLFTYNPFHGLAELPVAGPVYIHEGACEPFRGKGFPEELRGLPLVAQAHRGGSLSLHALDGEHPEPVLEALLADPGVSFLTLRNGEAGCFIARVERGAQS